MQVYAQEIASSENNELEKDRPDWINEIWYGKDKAKAIRQFKNDALLTRLQIVFTILGIIVFIYTIYRMMRQKS
jgi:hypothetical protein